MLILFGILNPGCDDVTIFIVNFLKTDAQSKIIVKGYLFDAASKFSDTIQTQNRKIQGYVPLFFVVLFFLDCLASQKKSFLKGQLVCAKKYRSDRKMCEILDVHKKLFFFCATH